MEFLRNRPGTVAVIGTDRDDVQPSWYRELHRMQNQEPGSKQRPFQPTRWSMVMLSRGNGASAQKAMEELCQMYWFPLYAWCRARGKTAHDAEDLIQGFFLQIIRHELFATADPAKGRLRTYLLTALQRYMRDEFQKSHTTKRGGGQVLSIDPAAAEACYSSSLLSNASPEETYDRQWALTVLDHAMAQLESDCRARGKQSQFLAMRPFLTDQGDMESYEKAADELGMSLTSFKVGVHRMRTRFREALLSIVSDTQASDDFNPEEEISYLATVLARK